MNNTQKKRLLKLAAFLAKVPKEQYDQNVYLRSDSLKEAILKIKDGFCHTEGCALGWCTSIFPEFSVNFDPESYELSNSTGYEFYITLNGIEIDYESSSLHEFFGITRSEADDLFGPSSDDEPVTPKEKSEEIYDLVESYS